MYIKSGKAPPLLGFFSHVTCALYFSTGSDSERCKRSVFFWEAFSFSELIILVQWDIRGTVLQISYSSLDLKSKNFFLTTSLKALSFQNRRREHIPMTHHCHQAHWNECLQEAEDSTLLLNWKWSYRSFHYYNIPSQKGYHFLALLCYVPGSSSKRKVEGKIIS